MMDWNSRLQRGFHCRITCLLELALLSWVSIFSLTAHFRSPQPIFSLHDGITNCSSLPSRSLALSSREQVRINLPENYQKQYGAHSLMAYRLYKSSEGVSNSSEHGTSLSLNLHELLQNTGHSTDWECGLFFYLVGLNQRPSQYRIRLEIPSLHYIFETHTPLAQSGSLIWYGRLREIPAVPPDARITLEALTPGSKGFLCDWVIYHASTLTYMREFENGEIRSWVGPGNTAPVFTAPLPLCSH